MYPKSFKRLIDHFSSLPGVGPKMAERLVLFLFKRDQDELADFARSLDDFKSSLRSCRVCGNISEDELCHVCQDSGRDRLRICVVEDALDVIAIERTKRYDGLYHVLGGVLDPSKTAGKDNLRIRELESRAASEGIEEIILATNPTTEGDATALYLARMLKDSGIRVTRLARGLSTGSDIEYADELTLSSAVMNRKEV